mmetsp:Transcript_18030/g.27211  ORF Transcript_18030/g.27211 Transcript_18030/m.27211 type:complete len:250 (+) Transcript_18030:183-932(+)|eukprot:CAMPEP_0194754738 /NCGR_PEP_ID=MMETSP0323_2-20130528/8666_1 /TAXON_ID=2866 ORGANISM="Crypthecodinium cohnii, Strain Seligo" /NCGR_SAMPLE_ID=MMETSP0323_2 /ASSEMBLY_ACC=CAM_ASM_000346 /LENGTH=249 /DNA_ID=CAMNT_0039673423 /DNA_START=111 /DNA_END=860 /DNA_ORIENTATION=+
MSLVNASFPINASELNLTPAYDIADTLPGHFELPVDTWGIVIFLGLAAMAAALSVGYYYTHSEPMALAAVLAYLVLSIPVGNLFIVPSASHVIDDSKRIYYTPAVLRTEGSHGDRSAAMVIGVVQVGLLCMGLFLTFRVVSAALAPKRLVVKCVPHVRDGTEYPQAHVGCNKCGRVLSLDYFFSDETCTKSKTGCQISYELCQHCLLECPHDHEVLCWENGKCIGQVDFEATQKCNMEEAQALLANSLE